MIEKFAKKRKNGRAPKAGRKDKGVRSLYVIIFDNFIRFCKL